MNLFGPDALISEEDWIKQVDAITVKIKRELRFKEDFFYRQQFQMYRIELGTGFEDRIAIEEAQLKESFYDGASCSLQFFSNDCNSIRSIVILERLSSFNEHPLAAKAGEIVTIWTAQGSNRIWLIMQYIGQGIHGLVNGYQRSNYEGKLKSQLSNFVEQLGALKKTGQTDEVKKLIFQLIDLTIEMDSPVWPSYADKAVIKQYKQYRSLIYASLLLADLSADIIDDKNIIDEIEIHQAVCEGKACYEDRHAFQCLTKAADMSGRFIPAYRIARMWCPDASKVSVDLLPAVLDYLKKATD